MNKLGTIALACALSCATWATPVMAQSPPPAARGDHIQEQLREVYMTEANAVRIARQIRLCGARSERWFETIKVAIGQEAMVQVAVLDAASANRTVFAQYRMSLYEWANQWISTGIVLDRTGCLAVMDRYLFSLDEIDAKFAYR